MNVHISNIGLAICRFSVYSTLETAKMSDFIEKYRRWYLVTNCISNLQILISWEFWYLENSPVFWYWILKSLKTLNLWKIHWFLSQCKILRSFTRLSCFISAGTGFGSHLVKCRILSFTPRLVAAKKEKTKKTHILSNSVF